MNRFVIVSHSRCGSTMLGGALGQHRQVLMHGEIFGSHHFPLNFYGIDENLPWPTPLEIALKKQRDQNPLHFLREYVFADTGRTAVGFKFKFEEFCLWDSVRNFLIEEKIPVIRLARRNLFDRFLSAKSAEISGFFNSTDKTRQGSKAKEDLLAGLTIDMAAQSIEMALQDLRHFEASFEGNRVLSLDYDDLVLNWFSSFNGVCDFLGIQRLRFSPISTKREIDNRLDLVFDIRAARQELAARGFADFV